MSRARRYGAPLGRRIGVAALIGILAILLDQATKTWALDSLEEGRRIPLIGELLSLQLVRNSGAAFSLGASATWIFTLFALGILALLGYALSRTGRMRTAGAIGLLMGGALGNLIDRLIRPPSFGQGHVIDFINYGGFFVGNVADIWIVIGAAWLALELMRESPEEAALAVSSGAGTGAGERP